MLFHQPFLRTLQLILKYSLTVFLTAQNRQKDKPDFCFISEPWMEFDSLPRSWFTRLDYKLFALNNIDTLQPNLWCLCTFNLNPKILNITDQLVSFTFDYNNIVYGFTDVYASTCYLKRRELWQSLQTFQLNHTIPWCFMGDFNSI